MAIKKDTASSNDAEITIKIDNGDLEALKKLQKLWNLKDEEATIQFAVGILRLSEHNKKVLIQPEGTDIPVQVNPGKKLLKVSDDTAQVE